MTYTHWKIFTCWSIREIVRHAMNQILLITYPNLGHLFYPSSQWSTGIGPFQPYVLADIYALREIHSGISHPYVAVALLCLHDVIRDEKFSDRACASSGDWGLCRRRRYKIWFETEARKKSERHTPKGIKEKWRDFIHHILAICNKEIWIPSLQLVAS